MKAKIQNFFKLEIAIGVLLLIATILALFAANSPLYELYRDFFAMKIPLNLNFIRKDSNSCLEEVVMPDFNIRRHLPLNERVTIEILPKKKGVFVYACGMNMFHGKIIVE